MVAMLHDSMRVRTQWNGGAKFGQSRSNLPRDWLGSAHKWSKSSRSKLARVWSAPGQLGTLSVVSAPKLVKSAPKSAHFDRCRPLSVQNFGPNWASGGSTGMLFVRIHAGGRSLFGLGPHNCALSRGRANYRPDAPGSCEIAQNWLKSQQIGRNCAALADDATFGRARVRCWPME